MSSDTADGRKVGGLNARTDGLYEGRESERTSDNTEGNSSVRKPINGTGYIKTGADGTNFTRYISAEEAEESGVKRRSTRSKFHRGSKSRKNK